MSALTTHVAFGRRHVVPWTSHFDRDNRRRAQCLDALRRNVEPCATNFRGSWTQEQTSRAANALPSMKRAELRRAERENADGYLNDDELQRLRAEVAELDAADDAAGRAGLDGLADLAELDTMAAEIDVSRASETATRPPPLEVLRRVRTVAPTRAPSLARVRATTTPE